MQGGLVYPHKHLHNSDDIGLKKKDKQSRHSLKAESCKQLVVLQPNDEIIRENDAAPTDRLMRDGCLHIKIKFLW